MRTKFAFISALFLLFIGQVVFAQVTGTVQDDYGPVADAEVIVRGGDASAVTDGNGSFSIEAKVGDVLTITDAMGTAQDFNVTKNNMGTLKFGAAIELEVITVTSVFDPTEKIQSGATVVGAEKIESLNPSTSIDEMLQGKASGVFSVSQNGGPGSVANINVRGAISLTGGLRPPLYVVDGSYMDEESVISINPNDVEEIKILKEASQTAVYGARGANGVVIIKTKTAKKGTTQMSYKSRYGFGENVPYNNITLMDAQQLLDYENNLSQLVNPTTGQPYGMGVAHSPEEMSQLVQNNHNWSDTFFKESNLVSHHFSIQTSGDKSATNISIGYDANSGTVVHYQGLERISASIGNRTEARDWLRYGYNVSGAYTTMDEPRDRRNGQSPFTAALMYRPYAPVYLHDEDGNPVLDAYGDQVYNTSQIPIGLGGYPTLDEMQYTDRVERNLRIFGSAFLDVTLFKNVTARTSFGATYDRFVLENFRQPRALLNGLLTPPTPGGAKTDTSDDRLDYNWRNEVTYSNSWGEHNFSATVASEFIKENYYRLQVLGANFPNNFQNVQSLAASTTGTSRRWLITRFGYLGLMSYNFANKYFVDAYFRRDGSSLVGQENQYGNFWGASVGWDIAKENFLASSTWVNNLSLRASYGEVGDDGVLVPYQNLNLILTPTTTNTGQGINYGGNPYVFPSWNVADAQMTWESVRKMNFGLEFSLLKHRLRGKVDYFQEYKTDFLFDSYLSPTMGGFVSTINAGEFVNKGFEVELNYDLFPRQSEFQLALFANFTHLNYEVTDLNGLEEYSVPQFEGGPTMTHMEGYSPYTWKVVRYAGVDPDNGDALYYDLDGNITNVFDPNNAVMTDKSPLPDMYGGFGLNASYKGFDIGADFTYTMGNYITNLTMLWLTDPVLIDGNRDVSAANYWQNPGDTDVLPAPTPAGYEMSDMYLEKGDYLRFRSLTFGYTFDTKLFERLPIEGVRIYLQAQNLATWTKFRGNPVVGDGSREDFAVGTAQYVSGSYSAFAYPQVRTYTFGINVNF